MYGKKIRHIRQRRNKELTSYISKFLSQLQGHLVGYRPIFQESLIYPLRKLVVLSTLGNGLNGQNAMGIMTSHT